MPCGRRLCGLPALSHSPPPLTNSHPRLQVHAYDDARAYLDWSNLTHQAAAPYTAPAKATPCHGSCAPPHPAAATIALHAAISIAISIAISRHLPLSRLAQACTEIRAASLSGDCTWNREARATPPRRAAPLPPAPRRATSMRCMRRHVMDAVHAVHGVHDMHGRRAQINRGNVFLAVSGAGARCIRRRAELSVSMNPACPSASAAARAVEDAWGHCFKDRAPFPQALENPPGFSI